MILLPLRIPAPARPPPPVDLAAARRGGRGRVDVGAADPGGRRPVAGHRLLAQRAGPADPRRGAARPAAGRRRCGDLDGRERRLVALSPACSSPAHFATWVPSLSFTSVASSVALVATQPVWAALIARWRGEHVPRLAWWGIGVGAGRHRRPHRRRPVDLAAGPVRRPARPVSAGCWRRPTSRSAPRCASTVSTTVYATVCYGVAAGVLLAVCVAGRARRSPATTATPGCC